MHKIINRNRDAYFTMDATGSIAKKLILPDGNKSAHVFLYQCMISQKDKRAVSIPNAVNQTRRSTLNIFPSGNS